MTLGRRCSRASNRMEAIETCPAELTVIDGSVRKSGFAPDSLLEGDGFEPSVPQQIRSDLGAAGPSPITVDSLATRNWKFESISLQRLVSNKT